MILLRILLKNFFTGILSFHYLCRHQTYALYSGQFIHYDYGSSSSRVHVDAVHTQNPGGEFFTGEMAEHLTRETGASCLISRISRQDMDLNRPRSEANYPAVNEYRKAMHQILNAKGLLNEQGGIIQPFLHLSFHGMRDDWGRDIEIGTGYGHYCNPDVKTWFSRKIGTFTENWGIDDIFPGYTFRSVLRDGDSYGATGFTGFGSCFNTLQVEISKDLRNHHQQPLIAFFARLISAFQAQFVEAPWPAFSSLARSGS